MKIQHLGSGFSLSSVWRNEKIRSVLIQILVVCLVFLFLSILIRNMFVNLENVGKELSFDFLFYPAAYDISFSPFLDYSSRSTHLKAAVVGLLNTLLVSGCGILMATILGVIFGILRLSKNWLVNKTVYIYLEFSRNVPLLLHILFVYGIIVTALPPAKKSLNFVDTIYLSNRGLYVPSPVWGEGSETLLFVFVLSIIAIILFCFWSKRNQVKTGKTKPVFIISVFIIIIPITITYILSGSPMSWDVPTLKGFNFKGGTPIKPEFLALWFALSYYTASFIAEIVRGGILAVDYGQTEAAYAVGLRPNRALQLIILPQALRVIVPPLASQYLNLTKNSSLAIAIGYMDLVATVGGISLMQTGKEVETMLIVLCVYLIISLTISAFMNWFNYKTRLVNR
jgi:general L-amino acid transport system permease protein